MICPSCGTNNRPAARFCARCGAALTPPPQPHQQPLQPSLSYGAQGSTVNTSKIAGKVTLFGGHGLLTIGALIALFAFMLPWASCSGMARLSGFDIATSPPYTDEGGELSALLVLVPLGALALGAVGLAGIVLQVFNRALPPSLGRLLALIPLLALPPALCGCLPCCAFFSEMQQAVHEADSWGLGELVRIEYGFWLTLFGLFAALLGALLALVGGLLDRRTNSPP